MSICPEKFPSFPATSPSSLGDTTPAGAASSLAPAGHPPRQIASTFADWTCPRCRTANAPRVLVCPCSGREAGDDDGDPLSPLLQT